MDVNTFFSEWIFLESSQHSPFNVELHFQSEIIVVGHPAASLCHVGGGALLPVPGGGDHLGGGASRWNAGRAGPVLLGVGCVPFRLPGVVELTLVGVGLGVAAAAAWVRLALKRNRKMFVDKKMFFLFCFLNRRTPKVWTYRFPTLFSGG